MRPPRVSIRGLLVVVAVVALLIPFPTRALVSSIGAFAIWVCVPVLVGLICSSLVNGRLTVAVSVAIVFAEGCVLPLFMSGPISPNSVPFRLFTLCLTPINLVGPIVAACRIGRDRSPASGEMLWAWMGVVWIALSVNPRFRWMHGGWMISLEFLVEFAQLTSVFALLLALYGRRPMRPEPMWSHRLGWMVAECDVIAWGWYALI